MDCEYKDIDQPQGNNHNISFIKVFDLYKYWLEASLRSHLADG